MTRDDSIQYEVARRPNVDLRLAERIYGDLDCLMAIDASHHLLDRRIDSWWLACEDAITRLHVKTRGTTPPGRIEGRDA